ncbi:MAG: hypothetical protein OXL97_02840 [Chloroflexota bacterium]|nr:hypothetical protein [Chloroflexota bacterium]
MFDLSLLPIAILTSAAVAVAVAAGARRGWLKHEARQAGPEYVWLAFVERYTSPLSLAFAGAETAEATEDTYRGAYLLLMAGLRMELMMAEFFIESGALLPMPRARVVNRVTYATEAFRPHLGEIKSLEDFGQYAPYRGGRMWMMKLSVHPDDADEAVIVLERAGISVEMAEGPQPWWHRQNVQVY